MASHSPQAQATPAVTRFRRALAAARSLFSEQIDPKVEEEQRKTLLTRAKAACWVGFFVFPFTILSYDAAFFPQQLGKGIGLVLVANTAVLLLRMALQRPFLAKRPSLAFAVLAGVISNATEAGNLALTGGPTSSEFFFPYYLIFFAIATLFPARFATVLITSLLLPLGYFVVGMITHAKLSSEQFVSNLIFLVDYAGITCIGNRLVTSIFLREVRLRLDLEGANERLRELDRVKNEFFANVSHELRTPLTLVLAPANSLLAADTLRPQDRAMVDVIRRNAQRLLTLINDLLLLVKLESSRLARRTDPVDLAETARRAVELATPHAHSLGLSVELHVDAGLPTWYGDATHVERMLLNLLSNACKFSQSGGTIRVSARAQGDGISIAVADQGIGIAAADLKRLFDRFVQLESSANRRFEGTGIGLAIVKELAELHGGRVSVESEQGRGSTFSIHLPARKAPDVPAAVPEDWTPPLGRPAMVPAHTPPGGLRPVAPPPLSAPEMRAQPPPPSAQHVFIVEDNLDLLTFLERELSAHFRVTAFDDSSKALQAAIATPPDLILSDVMMPVMDGLELARQLRAHPATSAVPILMLSAAHELGTKLAGFSAGVNDYVHKPFETAELLARISTQLRLRAKERELGRTADDLRSALTALQQAQASLVQHEKMASLGRVVAGVAHEINNPLHFLKGNVGVLRRRVETDLPAERAAAYRAVFGDLDESIERMASMTRDLLLFGRKTPSGQRNAVRAVEVVDLAFRVLGRSAGPGVKLVHTVGDAVRVKANAQDLFQITLNLVHNALQAVDPKKGEVRVDTAEVDGMVELRVADDGCGIPAEHLARIFDPFFTTKPPGEGTGLGLSIAHELVVAQQGSIAVTSEAGKGTTFRVRLPRGEA